MRLFALTLSEWAEVAALNIGSLAIVVLSIIGLIGVVAWARLRDYRNQMEKQQR